MTQRTQDADFTFCMAAKSSALEEDLVAMQLVHLQAPAERQAYARKLDVEKKIFREQGALQAQQAILLYLQKKSYAYEADVRVTQDEINALGVERAALAAYLNMKK